jgi:hypothetical protein
MVILEATPPATQNGVWKVDYQFASNKAQAPQAAKIVAKDGSLLTFEVPLEQPNEPGIKARLRIETRFWNTPVA